MLKEAVQVIAFDIGGTLGRVALLNCLPLVISGTPQRQGIGERRGRLENKPTELLTLPPFEIVPIRHETLQRASDESGEHWSARLIKTALKIAPELPRVAAVSFGGPVDHDGRIQSMHVPGWEGVDLAGDIARAFRISKTAVALENDANAGALGEHRFGAGLGTRDMLYFTVSTGIGGGAILDGKLRRGFHGFASEFGHMILDTSPNAPQYAAGKRGALEALASGPAIARDARAALETAGLDAPEILTAKEVFESAAAGKPWAISTLDHTVAQLARGIATAVCAYDVERVVVGGGVALAGPTFFDPLRKQVDQFLPAFFSGKVDVVPAKLGDRAPMYGAVAACLE